LPRAGWAALAIAALIDIVRLARLMPLGTPVTIR